MRVKVRFANPTERDTFVEVEDALVDTGATWTTLPRRIADELGLVTIDQVEAQTANGPVTVDHSFAMIEYDGRQSVSDVMVSDTYPGVLIGVVTLEGLRLAVDPTNKRLVDSDLLLL